MRHHSVSSGAKPGTHSSNFGSASESSHQGAFHAVKAGHGGDLLRGAGTSLHLRLPIEHARLDEAHEVVAHEVLLGVPELHEAGM